MPPPSNTGHSRVELMRRVSAPELSSKYLMLPSDATLDWRHDSRRAFSRSQAYILRLCGLGIRIPAKTLISRLTSDRCLSRSTLLEMAQLFLTQTLAGRISQCKTRRLCPSTTRL